MQNLMKGAETIVTTCLNITPWEDVLIVTDRKMMKIAKAIYEASKRISTTTRMLIIKPTGGDGIEPPRNVAKAMKSADVVIAPTSFSLTHTKARAMATKNGARIASMPNVSELSFTRGGLTADYNKLKKLTEKMYPIIKNSNRIEVKSKNGTNISFSVKGMVCHKDTGLIQRKYEFGNLPAGEVDTGVKNANGRIVFDFLGSFGRDIEVCVKNNSATNTDSEKLEEIFAELDGARNIAEFGIGTNTKAKIINNVLEYEKVHGTVHMALGNNKTYGGNVDIPFHLDGLIANPTVKVEGRIIIEKGKWKM